MATTEFTTEELSAEEWRPVVGREGFYCVSNLGRVKRLAGRVPKRGGIGTHVLVKEHMQSLKTNPHGYPIACMTVNNVRSTRTIHKIVMEAFSSQPKGLEVNHIDGNKLNNRITNLEWCTRGENVRHAVRLGLLRSGERHRWSKLTVRAVREIRALRLAGLTYPVIAKRFGVSIGTVQAIAERRSWKSVP